MELRFSKYHGCGNDFIIVRESDAIAWGMADGDYGSLARVACHRKTGPGADGLILLRGAEPGTPPEAFAPEMIFYNSDGSRAPMCGNGIRCFANYLYDEKLCMDMEYGVKTAAGIMGVKVIDTSPFAVQINMGSPLFEPRSFGVMSERRDFIKQDITVKDKNISVSSCFMGTVHTVLWTEELRLPAGGHIDFDEESEIYGRLSSLGRAMESHEIFTEKTNVNMAEVIDRETLKLLTYERGVGMTCACGTGACASVVMGFALGKCGREADVLLPYGKLHITLEEDGGVLMSGPAAKICSGWYAPVY